ncbi:hypothetical protein CRUP_027402 [Coryphaenoides rupestris]|nr:hypothetical protein CRUP_027402 [Coryphaenoides rupestris]
MAAYMRSVVLLLSTERVALLRKSCGYTVNSQRYVRALRRTPVKVLYPDEPKPRPAPEAPAKTTQLKKKSPAPGRIPNHVSPGAEESPVPRVVSVARSRTFREQQGKILLEGKRLICDALEAGAQPPAGVLQSGGEAERAARRQAEESHSGQSQV